MLNYLSFLTFYPPLFLSSHLTISTKYLFRVVVKVYFHPTFPRLTSQRRTTKWQATGMHCAAVLSCATDKAIKILERCTKKTTFRTRALRILSPDRSTVPHAKCEKPMTINLSQHCRMLSNTQAATLK
jgi:hypothetical protein